MTAHQPIAAPVAATIDAWAAQRPDVDRQAYHAAAHVIEAYHQARALHPEAALTTLDHLLELAAPELPDFAPAWSSGKADCEDWADWAPESLLVNMLAACLRRLDRKPLHRVNPMKRALAAIWNDLPERDRAAFLEYVTKGRT